MAPFKAVVDLNWGRLIVPVVILEFFLLIDGIALLALDEAQHGGRCRLLVQSKG